jgi:small-conductance mechanosensitive channel
MSDSTRGAVQLLVGAWYVAGAVLVIALLAQGDVNGLAARTGGSAFAIIAFGFLVAAGVGLAERESWAGLFGALAVLISISTFFLLAVEIWSKHPLQHATRTFVMVAVSLLLGAIALLLDGERDEDEDPVRLARGVASLALVALGVLIVLGACGVDISPRLGGIAAALFIVPVLSLPALRLISDES